MGKKYWTEELCLQEAKKYKTKSDFFRQSYGAYSLARKKGWLKSYDFFQTPERKKKWNYKNCTEEALKYKTRWHFQVGCKYAYIVAMKNGWIEKYFWFKPSRTKIVRWSFDLCKERAIKFSTIKEFRKNDKSAYAAAVRHGWINEFDWFL